MPGVRLAREQAASANDLLKDVQERLKKLSGGDTRLLFSLRRRIYVRLSYDERSTPAARKKLKERKWKEQHGKCAIGGEDLPISGAELDRRDPIAGYTPENTQLVCHEHLRKQQEEDGFRNKRS
jgi:hypothetical protein